MTTAVEMRAAISADLAQSLPMVVYAGRDFLVEFDAMQEGQKWSARGANWRRVKRETNKARRRFNLERPREAHRMDIDHARLSWWGNSE